MILTEAEARKKWCPFTQIGTHTERVIAEGGDEDDGKDWDSHTLVSGRGLAVLTAGGATNPHAVSCIASGCMAWRGIGQETEIFECYQMGEKPEGKGWNCTLNDKGRESFQLKSRWERPNQKRPGYCGLAGKP